MKNAPFPCCPPRAKSLTIGADKRPGRCRGPRPQCQNIRPGKRRPLMPHVSTPRSPGWKTRPSSRSTACPPIRTTAFMWTGSSRSKPLDGRWRLCLEPLPPPRARPGFTRRTPTFRRSVPSLCPATSKRRATASCSTSTPSTRGRPAGADPPGSPGRIAPSAAM